MFSIRFEVLKNSPNYRKKGNYKIYICLNYKWNSHWNTVNVGTRFLRQWSSIYYFLFQQANEVKSSNDMGLKGCRDFFCLSQSSRLDHRYVHFGQASINCKVDKRARARYEALLHLACCQVSVKEAAPSWKGEWVWTSVKWQRAIKNHLHWCATSTKLGFKQLILAKWKSIVRHVCSKHDIHPDPLFRQCVHGPISRRYWLKKGEWFWQILLQQLLLLLLLKHSLGNHPTKILNLEF